MIIVAGHLFIEPGKREEYLLGCMEVISMARQTEGCIDFSLTLDPIDLRRINVFEQWDSIEAVEAFRGSGPSEEQSMAIIDASVFQYEVDSSIRL